MTCAIQGESMGIRRRHHVWVKAVWTMPIVLFGCAAVAIGTIGYLAFDEREVWPNPPGNTWIELGKHAAEKFHADRIKVESRIVDGYSANGDYLNYGKTKSFRNGERIKMDDQGLPMVRYGQGFWYNPVTLSQYALAAYGKWLDGGDIGPMVRAIDKLISMQSRDGAFRYRFPYRHYVSTPVK